MALPASGTISMNDIRAELGIPSQAPFDLNTARAGGYRFLNPYSPSLPPSSGTVSLASWYNYCHTCNRYPVTVYWPGEVNISTTPAIACGLTTIAYSLYSNCSTLNNGCRIWSDLFGLWVAGSYPGEWYKTSDGRTFQLAANGDIINMQSCITCTEYYNYQSYDIFVYYNDCLGNAQSGYIRAGQSWCAQDGSVSGDPGWGSIGSC